MNQLFTTTAVGRIVKPVEKNSNGKRWFTFSLAVNEPKFNTQKNEWENKTLWINCKYFPYDIEDKKPMLFSEGRSVIVRGKIEAEAWIDKNGNMQSRLAINISSVANIPNDSRAFQEESQRRRKQREQQQSNSEAPDPKPATRKKGIEKVYEEKREPAPDIDTLSEQSGELPDGTDEDDMPF
jgi:single stranded DNA-binding protein